MGWKVNALISAAQEKSTTNSANTSSIATAAPTPDFVHRIAPAPWNVSSLLGGSSSGNSATMFRAPRRTASQRLTADVNCLSSDPVSECLYAGCGDAVVYAIDVSTGQTVQTLQGHTGYLHCVKASAALGPGRLLSGDEAGEVLLWDQRQSGERPHGRCSFDPYLKAAHPTIFSTKRAWCSSIDVDASGNFLYACGGAEGPSTSTTTSSSSGSIGSGTSSSAPIAGAVSLSTVGWAAACLLGDVSNSSSNSTRGSSSSKSSSCHMVSSLQPVTSTALPVPVQRGVVAGDDLLVCAGPQPQLRYLSRTTLDVLSVAPINCLSAFALAAATGPNEQQFLAVSGTFPAVDVFRMRGGLPQTLLPHI